MFKLCGLSKATLCDSSAQTLITAVGQCDCYALTMSIAAMICAIIAVGLMIALCIHGDRQRLVGPITPYNGHLLHAKFFSQAQIVCATIITRNEIKHSRNMVN